MANQFEGKKYRNMFMEVGIEENDIAQRLEDIKDYYFYGGDDERVYYPVGTDMGYICDTGNNDVRTEGMSYGMMICVQLDMKEEFDRIWKWAKTYMWMSEGENEGYFAWSCATDGKKNAYGRKRKRKASERKQKAPATKRPQMLIHNKIQMITYSKPELHQQHKPRCNPP